MALPLPLRNRLAELILDALRTSEARQALGLVWRFCADQAPSVPAASLPTGYPLEFFERRGDALVLKGDYGRFRDEMCERVSRAWKLLSRRSLSDADPSLGGPWMRRRISLMRGSTSRSTSCWSRTGCAPGVGSGRSSRD